MYCGKCGAKNSDNNNFCINCGCKLANNLSDFDNYNNSPITINNNNKDFNKINNSQNKKVSTIWLDFISAFWGIVGVLSIILSILNIFISYDNIEILIDILSIICGFIGILCLYYVHTRKKLGYYFFIYTMIINFITGILSNLPYLSNSNEYFIGGYIFGYIISLLIFFIPNYIYISKRKNLFIKNEIDDNNVKKSFYVLLFSSIILILIIYILMINL